jgi:hypothetical protein
MFALLTCSDQTRSAEAVQERLDRLGRPIIGEINKLKTSHMNGKSGQPANFLIVRIHLFSLHLNVTSLMLSHWIAWQYSARTHEEITSLPHEFPLHNGWSQAPSAS